MKKVASLKRRNVVFGGAFVALLAVLLLRPSETSVVSPADLPLLLPKFREQAAQVKRVRIEVEPPPKVVKPDAAAEPPATPKAVDLVRRDESRWLLASSFDHPVRDGAVQRLLDGIGAARRRDWKTGQVETFPKYADEAGWVHVTALDDAGQVLATFRVGKSAQWPDLYVRLEDGGKERVALATGLERDAVSVTTDAWVEALLWRDLRADAVSRLDVEQRRDQRTLSFERQAAPATGATPDAPAAGSAGSEKKWRLVSPKEGEGIQTDVENLVRSFSGMRIEDVVAGATTPEADKTYGFDDPELVITAKGPKPEKAGAEPPAWVLTVGKKTPDGKGWYVRRAGQSWTYTVPDYALDTFRKDPDSYLVKKDEPKPGDGKPGEPPADGEPKDGDDPKDGEPKDGEKKDGEKPDGATGDPDGR